MTRRLPRLEMLRAVTAALVLGAGVAQPLAGQTPAVVSGAVRNAVTRTPVPRATVQLVGSGRTATTDGDGRYRLVLNAGESQVRTTAVGFAPASQTLSLGPGASAVVDFALQPSTVPLAEVVTVGARAPERTVASSPVPVDVISSELLQSTGMVETWQQLQRLVPSLNAPHIPIGDNHMRPVTLRGLAPHHVLVLINGKRRHPASVLLAGPVVSAAALTDLNAIPSSAIERIEILRDGAAAQYGSDAIGGVVNIVLKSGARREYRTSVGEVYSSEGGRTFHDGRLLDVNATLGFTAANGGFLTLSAESRDRSGTNRAYPDRRTQYFAGDPRNNEPPRVSSHFGDGTVHDLSLFVNGATPIGSSAEAYVFGGAARRNDVVPDAFFRLPVDDRTVRAIHPNGFLPRREDGISDASIIGGVRGSWRDWRWDVSSGPGGNSTAYRVHDSDNASLGSMSPTDFFAGRVSAGQWTSNVDVERQLTLGSLPLSVASGAEFRVETYRITAGEPDSWRDGGAPILDGPHAGAPAAVGAQGFAGFRPTDAVSARRSSSAGYVEASARPVEALLLQVAARAEHYSDFGSTTNGKIATRLQILPGVALRGSASTGFRAPALTQAYYSSSGTLFRLVNGVNTVLTVRTFPVNTAEAQLMGAKPLRPERSVNSSAGLVVEVQWLPVITADVYGIDIDDRIYLASAVTDSSIVRLFEENGMRGIGGGSYFRNAIDTRTRGIDVLASHSFLLGRASALRIVAGYNDNRTAVTRVAAPPPQLAASQGRLFTRMSRGVIENGNPRETAMFTFTYDTGPLEIDIHNQRSGPTAQLDQTSPTADQVLRPKWITDLRLSYRVRRRLQVSASVENLFDTYPDEWWDFKDGLNAKGVSMQGIYRYPGALSPFGMNGRTLFLQVAYR